MNIALMAHDNKKDLMVQFLSLIHIYTTRISKGVFSTVENTPFGTPRERKDCVLDLPLEVFL